MRTATTPETITDELIRDLHQRTKNDLDHETRWWNDNRHLGSPRTKAAHDEQVKELRQTIAICESALNPKCNAERKAEARSHCSRILNSRNGVSADPAPGKALPG